MSEPLVFESKEEFLARLRELRAAGLGWREVELIMPWHVHEVEEILGTPPSGVRFFALSGGVLGFLGGILFVSFTNLSWPLITGGKPIISVPPTLLIGYLLTILCGSLLAFGGFVLLARRPGFRQARQLDAFDGRFVILVRKRDVS